MFKHAVIFWTLASAFLASAQAAEDGPTLTLKLESPTTVRVAEGEIKITGPFAQGPEGKCGLAVGGRQDGVQIPAAEFVGDTGTILMTFCSKPRKPENSLFNCQLLALRGDARERVFIYQVASGPLCYAFKYYSDPSATTSAQPLAFERWYQAACTWDGSMARFYLDGVLQGETPQPYTPKFPANETYLYLGPYIDHYSNPAPWNEDSCLIREVTVYKRALNSGEIMRAAGVEVVDPSRQYRSLLAVPRVATAPTIDGVLDDAAWNRASSFVALIDGQRPEESLTYKDNNPLFCHDGKNLYIALRTAFPGNYRLVRGTSRGEKESDVWGSESFELWIDVGGTRFRFGGNVSGGRCESRGADASFSGPWQYETTNSVRIDDTNLWQAEICIPFETLGIAVGSELKADFCRSWRGLDRIGLTSFSGTPEYGNPENYATLKIADSDVAVQQKTQSNPNYSSLNQEVLAASSKDARIDYEVTLLSSSGSVPAEPLVRQTIDAAASPTPTEAAATIESANYDRLLFQAKDAASGGLLMQQVVPFKIAENYLDIVPAFASAQVFCKPRYTLAKAKAGDGPLTIELLSPSDEVLASHPIASNDEVALPFVRENPAGTYRAVLCCVRGGEKQTLTSKPFHYDGVAAWEAPINEERVLPPFEPLTVRHNGGDLDIGMWGRAYQYHDSLLPRTIAATKQPVLGGSAILIDGKPVDGPLAVTKSAAHRVELAGAVESPAFDLRQDAWIEYDGVLWNRLALKAKQGISGVKLKLDMPAAAAKFYHATTAGFGGGGRRTAALDADVGLSFWPVVWLGDQERGLSWFAESSDSWKTSDPTPIHIVRDGESVSLEITFADKLDAGQDLNVEFGLVATPVRPLPKDYPFTMFSYDFAVHLNGNPPHKPVVASALISSDQIGAGFFDLPLEAEQPTGDMKRLIESVQLGDKHHCVVMPYFASIYLPEDYSTLKNNLLAWQVSPANHLTYKRPGDAKDYEWYNLCAGSDAAKYFLARFRDLVKESHLKGVYFDFAAATPCSNRYHGCHGGYRLLAKRDLFKRVAGILADANEGQYTIVVHNSESVQIPAFTFATHFLNGEGLRQESSDVFHNGKDVLDTYTIADFASEHSSLPWGITSSIYIPTDKLLPRYGGDKEGPEELYKFRMTKAAMAGALPHNTIPGQSRLHYGWFNKVLRFYDDFHVDRAEFLPYWRNGEYVRVVQGKDIYVSFYRHHDKKEILAVVSHVSKEHLDQDVVVEFDPTKLGLQRLTSAKELLTGPDPDYDALYAETNRVRNPVELGDFGVEFLGLEGSRIKLRLKHHSVALVEIVAD